MQSEVKRHEAASVDFASAHADDDADGVFHERLLDLSLDVYVDDLLIFKVKFHVVRLILSKNGSQGQVLGRAGKAGKERLWRDACQGVCRNEGFS